MVRVPEYQPDVRMRPIFQQGVDVRATPDAFGAAVGRGMQSAARGVSQLGNAIAQVQALEDDARAKEADNQLAAWARERMYGEGGFMTLQGRNAVDGRAAFEQELEAKRAEFSTGLTPGAASAYSRASGARIQSILQQSIVHTANERKTWVNQASAARVATFGDDALANYNNASLVSRNIAAGQAEIRQQAELNGWDADKLALEESNFISGVHNNIALRIAQDDPLAAQAYVDQNRDSLSGEHQTRLNDVLAGPVRQARATELAADILGGSPTPQAPAQDQAVALTNGPTRAAAVARQVEERILPGGTTPVRPNQNGTYNPTSIAQSMIGMTEGANAQAIAGFVRNYAGLEIDPRTTAWCAAFVNAVLGSQGVEGTGALNARSFLSFGTAVDSPRMGDIVVLSRGDPNGWQGHVGFFMGYDADGNIRILGGNQGDGVNVSSYSADRLLGFRRPGNVPPGATPPATYTPEGLAHIEERLAAITDPQLREATRQQISRTIEAQNAAMKAQRERTTTAVSEYMIANPGVSPDDLPIEVQQTMGIDGMNTLWNWHDKVVTRGQPETDERVMFDLQTMYATEPQAFAQLDFFQFRDRLSNSDWEKVNGWRQSALSETTEARNEGIALSSAMTQAQTQLEAVGLTTTGRSGADREQTASSIARFQLQLGNEMLEFKRENNRQPNTEEIQRIVNRLLMPVVMREPGWSFNPLTGFAGEATTEGRLFQFNNLGLGQFGERTVELNYSYDDIPVDERVQIEEALRQQNGGRAPTQEEVVTIYEQFIMQSQFGGQR